LAAPVDEIAEASSNGVESLKFVEFAWPYISEVWFFWLNTTLLVVLRMSTEAL